jgi:hypothetical protein
MLKKILCTVTLGLIFNFAQANEVEQQLPPCFKNSNFSKVLDSNVSSFGGYGFDVQYIRFDRTQGCRLELDSSFFGSMSRSGDLRTVFKDLAPYNTFGSSTIMGVPPRERNIYYKRDSNHIIRNVRDGFPSEIVKFEMLNNDAREKLKNFNIVIRMATSKDNSKKPESVVTSASGKFVEGKRNLFVFTEDDYVVFVNIYPIKYPIPKR